MRRECDNDKNISLNMIHKLLTFDLQSLWYVCTYEQILLTMCVSNLKNGCFKGCMTNKRFLLYWI